MKHLIIILLICFVSTVSFGQKWYQRYINDTLQSGDTTFIMHSYAKAVYNNTYPVMYADYAVYKVDTIIVANICRQLQAKGYFIGCPTDIPKDLSKIQGNFSMRNSDTLIITDTAIHFIRVGRQLIDIKKNKHLAAGHDFPEAWKTAPFMLPTYNHP
jgi:hypothetical protein